MLANIPMKQLNPAHALINMPIAGEGSSVPSISATRGIYIAKKQIEEISTVHKQYAIIAFILYLPVIF